MHRFYIPPNEWNPDAPILTGAEAHHARTVLRLQPGDKAVLFNGQGREVTAEITALHRTKSPFGNCTKATPHSSVAASPLGRPFRKGKTWT